MMILTLLFLFWKDKRTKYISNTIGINFKFGLVLAYHGKSGYLKSYNNQLCHSQMRELFFALFSRPFDKYGHMREKFLVFHW